MGPGATVLIAAAAVVAVVAAGIIWWPTATSSTAVVASTPPDGELTAERQRANELQRRLAALDALDAEKKAAAGRLSNQLNIIAATVADPDVIVKRDPTGVQILFKQGLFARNTELTPAADTVLARLAPKLAASKITVVGHSVLQPGANPTGGTRTALARARLVSQHLADAGKLPLTAFTLTSGDQSSPPFPDPARNRTVTLLLTPA